MEAATQQKRREKRRKHKQCLWCKKRVAFDSSLCRICKFKHAKTELAAWHKKRPANAKRYRCRICGSFGHNARRHKGEK